MTEVKDETVKLQDEELQEVAGGINVEIVGSNMVGSDDKTYSDKCLRTTRYKDPDRIAFAKETAEKARTNSDKEAVLKELSIKDASDKCTI